MQQTNSSTSEQSQTYGYARMPRIIRKGYKDLSKMQKLLYIYLRDLCSETGTCYRSLRTLADETDFCISYLSINIPQLAKAGLITAEMKKRNGKKWEIWHISIVDIWEANAQFIQSEKCSRGEQNESVHSENCSPDEHFQAVSVHQENRKAQKCSRGTYNRESITTENPLLTEKEKETPASSFSPSSKKETIPPVPEKSTRPTRKQLIEEWFVMFDGLYRKKPGYTDTFKVSRSKSYTTAIGNLIDAGATKEQAAFVFEDICNDSNAFWLEHRTLTSVESQFATRVPKMHTKLSAKNAGSIQQQLYDKQPDFPHKSQGELAEMMPQERKEYFKRAEEYDRAKREQEERAQAEQQQVPA